jgi:hypothetical protein
MMNMVLLPVAMAALLASCTEAFAPINMSPMRLSSSAMQASDKPLTELCEITKEACEVVSPMLKGECKCSVFLSTSWKSITSSCLI